MRTFFSTFFLLFVMHAAFSQRRNAVMDLKVLSKDSVSFITVFSKSSATKDGFYIGDYVVEIDDQLAKKINGKKIRITGRVHTIKGLASKPKEYDKDGLEIVQQGRAEDKKHIASPVIDILVK